MPPGVPRQPPPLTGARATDVPRGTPPPPRPMPEPPLPPPFDDATIARITTATMATKNTPVRMLAVRFPGVVTAPFTLR